MDSKPATKKNYGKLAGKTLTKGPWAHLSEEKRIQHEAIEERVREKVRRGEL